VSVVELLEGAGSYTSLADVARTDTPVGAPEATPSPSTVVCSAALSLVLTYSFEC
jgi:hypothetical protein